MCYDTFNRLQLNTKTLPAAIIQPMNITKREKGKNKPEELGKKP